MGARSMSLANASVAIEDVWAFHHNPAALAEIKKLGFGVSYENRFLLKELQSQGLTAVIPLKSGVLSIGAQSFGYTEFRTYRSGLGYSLKLSDFLALGVQLNHHLVRINSFYGSNQTLTGEIGLLAKVNENLKIGVSVFNISRNKLSEFKEDRYTTLLRIGTGYKLSKKLLLLCEAEKNVDFPIRFKSGIEYQPIADFYIRGGFATEPIEYSFGVGYCYKKNYKLDIGSAYHQILGWSPHFSFTVQMN
jgi:long-subunit fatty acid transport protein